ncbi:sigma-70 family RNA polymerase sigma factor [Cohnella endophytica]|uniref:Sigma-70 family RNA polymerase sigma factor n=2 Tax=Cohnella endophytica TaxID=2419778 RepID=A0A494XKU6_9BACL|nr:sigma-70 family RNA polymerase sigma factor [Cohnella endophytica]
MRFVKFLVSTIKYCTIDQLRAHHKNDSRQILIFDRPVSEGGGTLGESLLGKKEIRESEPTTANPSQFQASFQNECLSQAFTALSQKQQLITTLCYALCYQDNEIARMIGVSPQAVCKMRNLALKKLRLDMGRG